MKVTARLVALVVLLAFARGPALACYALPAAAGATSDECCHMMGGACESKTPPTSAPRPCCHPDNLGDHVYVRSSTASTAAPQMTALVVLVLPAGDRLLAPGLSVPAVCSHAPPGGLIARLTSLRI